MSCNQTRCHEVPTVFFFFTKYYLSKRPSFFNFNSSNFVNCSFSNIRIKIKSESLKFPLILWHFKFWISVQSQVMVPSFVIWINFARNQGNKHFYLIVPNTYYCFKNLTWIARSVFVQFHTPALRQNEWTLSPSWRNISNIIKSLDSFAHVYSGCGTA